jgi:DNA-binding transcriptional regulator YiaG
MSELTKIFRTEMSRVAKREARGLVEPARRTATAARQSLVDLRRRVADLERELAALKKSATKPSAVGVAGQRVAALQSKGVKAQRDRFGMSAEAFGKLLGVSSQAIYNWEHGTARPRPGLIEKLAVLRTLGKREALAHLRALDGHGAKKP